MEYPTCRKLACEGVFCLIQEARDKRQEPRSKNQETRDKSQEARIKRQDLSLIIE